MKLIEVYSFKTLVTFALVDDKDYKKCLGITWYAQYDEGTNSKVYVASGKVGSLASFIIGKPKKGFVTDHINGYPLDNRRSNLRFLTRAENSSIRHFNDAVKASDVAKVLYEWQPPIRDGISDLAVIRIS